MCAPMKKPCEQTVSGEAKRGSFEEEIRKHAKTQDEIDEARDALWRIWAKDKTEKNGKVLDKFDCQKWVSQKVVLGVVAKTEAERQKQLSELLKEFPTKQLYCYEDVGSHSDTSVSFQAYDAEDVDKFKKKVEAFLGEGSGQQQEQKPQ